MKKKSQKEYEKFMSEQIKILTEHFQRAMLRCLNKLSELNYKEDSDKV